MSTSERANVKRVNVRTSERTQRKRKATARQRRSKRKANEREARQRQSKRKAKAKQTQRKRKATARQRQSKRKAKATQTQGNSCCLAFALRLPLRLPRACLAAGGRYLPLLCLCLAFKRQNNNFARFCDVWTLGGSDVYTFHVRTFGG